jgi:hypothetical protein
MAGTDIMVTFKVFLCSLIDIVVRVLREGGFWRDMAFRYHLEASVCFARKGDIFQNCGFLWVFQMGFFAEAGPVQIFVSNHVSVFSLQCALKNCNISSLSLRMPSGEFVDSIERLQYALNI